MLKRLFIAGLVWLVLVSACFATPAFHAVANGPNPNGGAFTTTLPTHSDGDYILLECVGGSFTFGTKAFNDIATWTTLLNGQNETVFGRFWHTGDATTVTCTPNGTGSFETSTIVSYSGVNATTPVDAANLCWRRSNNNNVAPQHARAPSTSPTATNDLLVLFYSYNSASSRTVTLPSGPTSRTNNTNGPSIGLADEAWSSSSPTGNLDGTWASEETQGMSGAQILLKDASPTGATTATAMPTMACISQHVSTDTKDYSDCNPQNNDLVAMFWTGANTGATMTGFNKVFATGTGSSASSGVALFTHTFLTGDTTTFSTTNVTNYVEVVLRNITNSNKVVVDTSNTNELASSTTATSSSLTLKSTNELYVVEYFAFPNSAYTWTANGTLLQDYGVFNSLLEQSQQSPANPTTTFNATLSAANDAWTGSVAFGLQAPTSLIPVIW